MRYKSFLVNLLTLIFLSQLLLADEDIHIIKIDKILNKAGAISFVLETNRTYRNGNPEESFVQSLIELPGLATCVLERSKAGIFIAMEWEKESKHIGFYLLFSDLPGPEKYHVLFTWDSNKGIADGYFNGIPFRKEKLSFYKPWKVEGSANIVKIPEGPNCISELKVFNYYLSKKEAIKLTPRTLKYKNKNLLGQTDLPKPININKRKGELLYSVDMKTKEDIRDWIFEGPGHYEFEENKMILTSEIPNPPDFSTGHYNFWCPKEFPDKIIVEWEFMPLVDIGACHIFIAAKGNNGENIFDPKLSKRDGHFAQYINGQINNYYFIYFSNIQRMRTTNMATTWITKSSKQAMLALGEVGIEPGNERFFKMRLIKDSAHIQLQIDGKVCLDYTDTDDDRYDAVLEGGKISFRQMAASVAAYKNFNVWELK